MEGNIPPPPQRIFEQLNGHIIGHYIMKKALSVAVYNHLSDVALKRNIGTPSDEGCISPSSSSGDLEQQQQQQQQQLSYHKPTVERYLQGHQLMLQQQEQQQQQLRHREEPMSCPNKNGKNESGCGEVERKHSNDSGYGGCKGSKESAQNVVPPPPVVAAKPKQEQQQQQQQQQQQYRWSKSESAIVKIQDEVSPVKTAGKMLTPVAKVIIEANTHKLHLTRTNALTFDPTGSSKPLIAIAAELARYLGMPFFKFDCRQLVSASTAARRAEEDAKAQKLQKQTAATAATSKTAASSLECPQSEPPSTSAPNRGSSFLHMALEKSGKSSVLLSEGRRSSLQESCWRDLVKVRGGETLQSAIQRLFKHSGYDPDRAERSLVFLDCLDKPGAATTDYGQDADSVGKEILKEIMECINGTKFEVTRPRNQDDSGVENAATDDEEETSKLKQDVFTLRTNHMFFLCFGVKGDLDSKETEEEEESKDAHSNAQDISASGDFNVYDFEQHRRKSVHFEDSYEDDDEDEDDYDSDEDDYESEDDSFQGLRESELTRRLLREADSLKKRCQALWGLVGIELRLAPEALEVMANRAAAQGAGADGVRTILEKLLLEVKFELPNDPAVEVEAVEVTEDFVLGKAPPTIYYRGNKARQQQYQERQQMTRSLPDISENRILQTQYSAPVFGSSRPVEFTEFEECVAEELALSL